MKRHLTVILLLSIIFAACTPASIPTPTKTPTDTLTPTLTITPTIIPTTTLALIPTGTSTVTLTPTAAPKFVIGSTQKSSIDGMVLLYVPAGDFQMGLSKEQSQAAIDICVKMGGILPNCRNIYNNNPDHKVYLNAFWIDRTLITNGMYEMCVKDGGCKVPLKTNSSTHARYYGNIQYADYPVIYTDWDRASAYCNWAGRALPTEAQWEKAARGTDGRTFPWGEGISHIRENYQGQDTTKVGSFPDGASPYGALDMAGNVWEWVNDWYYSSYYSNSPESNPQGPTSGKYHVLRGGSWINKGIDTPSAYRIAFDTTYLYAKIGFRCAAQANP